MQRLLRKIAVLFGGKHDGARMPLHEGMQADAEGSFEVDDVKYSRVELPRPFKRSRTAFTVELVAFSSEPVTKLYGAGGLAHVVGEMATAFREINEDIDKALKEETP